MAKFQIGDQVLVTAGKDKGKQGKIVKAYPSLQRVLVEGVNQFVKHIKPRQGQSGQRVLRPRPLNVGNIAIINDQGQPDRVGFEIDKKGNKQRIYRKTGKPVPNARPKQVTKS